MDPRIAVQRLLEMQADGIDPDILDRHLDDTAFELLTGICASLSFTVCALGGTSACQEETREQLERYLGAVNMILEVWDMSNAEVQGEPFLDEYDLGWMALN